MCAARKGKSDVEGGPCVRGPLSGAPAARTEEKAREQDGRKELEDT